MDIANTLAPKSDQMDYDDMLVGPRTLTIVDVKEGPSGEQPVEIKFAEFDRPWRPAKSMRRVLVMAWGSDTKKYIGHRVTLFGDASVKWAGVEVGGIRLSHLSHIDKPLSIALTISRGKRAPFVVNPLVESTPPAAITRSSLKESGANFGPGVGDVSSEKQMNKIGTLMGKLGMNETAQQLAYAGDVIEREIKSANEITMHEASRIITYLEKDLAKMDAESEVGE
jgi:hypothetical protein